MAAVDPADDVRDVVEQRLRGLLVLDPPTRAVFDVWLAFAGRARGARVRATCRQSVETLRDAGRTRPELDVDREAERLHALIDGLAMHATLDPQVTTPARQVEILARHLDALA
jgi:hypothetical protein